MHTVCRDIFRAIHEGKWLSVEYRNKQEEVTKYWIGIQNLNIVRRSLQVEGLHLGCHSIEKFNYIYIDSILSSGIIESSYCPVNEELVQDIHIHPEKYKALFDHVYNLKVLNYLEDCNRMDTTPYYKEVELVRYLDRDGIKNGIYQLDDEQFCHIVKSFQRQTEKKKDSRKKTIQQLATNVMSIHTPKGLYVLAYRNVSGVDDMPYVIGLGMDIVLDLHKEYHAVIEMYQKGEVSIPVSAFFGDVLNRSRARKTVPLILLDQKINLDQLLAVHNGMKYSLTYVQGPPGTGKTNTIINTVITAFFNKKTVLLRLL